MDGRPKRRASARRRAIAACALLLAAIGATVIAGPANADTADPSSTASGSTTVDDGLLKGASAVANVKVLSSTDTVYPVKDGYLDTARFAIIATNASGRLVPVLGTAVLTGGGRIVRTWPIDGATTRITWDGLVAHTVRPGLYALTVTATSVDGSIRTGQTVLHVSRKHLVRHEFVTSTRVDKHRTVKLLPSRLLAAYAFGQVSFRIETVAVVHGRAKLVFENNGIEATLRLRNGTHITPEQTLPQGFARVTVIHAWAPGAARLLQLKTIWIHYALE